MLASVANLNDKINVSTAQGMTPNALLDQRDLLLDKVSEYIPVSITYEKNNTVSLSLGTVALVRGQDQTGVFSIQPGATNDNPSIIQIKNEAGSLLSNDAYSLISSGKIAAILQMGGSDTNKLTIKGLTDSLDTLANQFASALNYYQANGRYIDSSTTPHELSTAADPAPQDFFVDSSGFGTITAKSISVNSALISDPFQIAAASLTSGATETGDGSNALLMSNVRNLKELVIAGPVTVMNLGGTTTQGYVTNLVGKLGTQSKNLQDNYDVKDNVLSLLRQKRESVIGVNLDEELADLVRFQRSYEASARVLTTISETLSTIINMMG